MLTAHGPMRGLRTRPAELVVGGLLGMVLFGLLIAVSFQIALPPPPGENHLPGVAPIGLSFLGVTETSPNTALTGVPSGSIPRTQVAYLLPFEIVSVHLLVVLIGAAYLARAKRRKQEVEMVKPKEGAA
jgi:NADH-quinone oxidoreductase subunit J